MAILPQLMDTSVSTSPSVGVQTKSPASNLSAPANTTSTPAPKDLSGTYANVNGTIYNKQSGTKFSNQTDFFKDSNQSSFDNLKFDTNYTPTGKETIYGQPAQTAPPPQPAPQQTPQPTPQATPAPTNPPAPQPYTPPNQGTTGVSQGGIIGNLINTANNESPEVTTARKNLQDLQNQEAQQLADNANNPIPLEFQQGRSGILQALFGQRQQAAQTALSSALTSQGQSITANQAAGNLNAPVTNPQTGGLVSPSANTTTNSTTSGAANLSSLIGQRPNATGQTEFFNTQTGQGFAAPQDLADFVNKQSPGVNATAQNVFDILKQQQTQGGALNPLNNVSSIAQQVLNGQISPSQAYAMGGTVTNWQGLLNQELAKQSGGSFDQSATQAKYDANQSSQGNQANQVAAFKSAYGQAQNLQSQLSDLITTFGLNPNDINAANSAIQAIASNISSPQYKALSNLVTDLVSTYSSILTPGSSTDTARATAASLLDPSAKGVSILSTLKALDQQAQAKIQGTQTPSTTGSNGANSTTLGLF